MSKRESTKHQPQVDNRIVVENHYVRNDSARQRALPAPLRDFDPTGTMPPTSGQRTARPNEYVLMIFFGYAVTQADNITDSRFATSLFGGAGPRCLSSAD